MPDRMDREQFYRDHGLWTDERLGRLPATAAARWGEREFAYVDGARFTYHDFWRWTVQTAHDLVSRGVGRGDYVLMQIANGMEVMVLEFAAWRIGAICVPVVPLYRQHELSAIVSELRPKVVAVSATLGSRSLVDEMEAVIASTGLDPIASYLIGGTDRTGWSRLPCLEDAMAADEGGLPEPSDPGECCLILYTSGSTSAPKGARLTQRGILSNSISYRLHQGLDERMVALAASPLAHVAALCTGVINPMTVGGRSVIMTAWKPEHAIELIEQERVTHFGTVVTFLQDIVEYYEKGFGGAHRLNLVSVGGAPTPASLISRADAVGIVAINQFGMTEVACNATLGHPRHPLDLRSEYCGKCMFGTEIEAVDADRSPLPAGEIGELRIRSPQMMLGYTSPEATADALDADGWFYTGDTGLVTADGWLRVTGRIKDIINRGGEKFSAQDIEMAVMSHPAIAVAAVVGAPHPRFGETVAAFVKLVPGTEWPGAEPLLAHLESLRLARSKFPVLWRVVDDFPRTATGKIFKQGLKTLLEAETAA